MQVDYFLLCAILSFTLFCLRLPISISFNAQIAYNVYPFVKLPGLGSVTKLCDTLNLNAGNLLKAKGGFVPAASKRPLGAVRFGFAFLLASELSLFLVLPLQGKVYS
jgi:hypothetical protein